MHYSIATLFEDTHSSLKTPFSAGCVCCLLPVDFTATCWYDHMVSMHADLCCCFIQFCVVGNIPLPLSLSNLKGEICKFSQHFQTNGHRPVLHLRLECLLAS